MNSSRLNIFKQSKKVITLSRYSKNKDELDELKQAIKKLPNEFVTDGEFITIFMVPLTLIKAPLVI